MVTMLEKIVILLTEQRLTLRWLVIGNGYEEAVSCFSVALRTWHWYFMRERGRVF